MVDCVRLSSFRASAINQREKMKIRNLQYGTRKEVSNLFITEAREILRVVQ